MKAAQRDALPAAFEAVERGLEQAEFPCELDIRPAAAFAAQVLRKLFLQPIAHEWMLVKATFHLRNVFEFIA